MNVTIVSDTMKTAELGGLIEQHLGLDKDGIMLETRTPEVVYRSLDPTILVAIVGATGTALGALITGLLQIAQQKSIGTIIAQSKAGSRIEIPIGVSGKELAMIIEQAKQLDSENIEILLP